MLKLLYISQLADPNEHDVSIYHSPHEGRGDIAWFWTRMGELGLQQALDYHGVSVFDHASLPPAGDFDAAILGGSEHMVAEATDWQGRLNRWLVAARASATPLLGICGGHQLMSVLMGAAVTRLADAPWAATLDVAPNAAGRGHWLFEGLAAGAAFHFGNSEHVCEVPAGAQVLASAGASPALALDYGGGWVSVQFHPEISRAAFERIWREEAPGHMANYRDAPEAPLLLKNFLVHAGLDPA